MGSKSGPAPDPRLVSAQVDSLDEMTANSRRLAPLQEEQMRYGLDAARRAQGQSDADREWMLTRRGKLSGLQDQIVDEANAYDSGARGNALAGQAIGDVSQQFDVARNSMRRGLERQGVNPESGRALGFQNQAMMGEATARAMAATKTRDAARQEGMTMKTNAANMLGGYPGMAMGATSAAAGFGASGLNVVNSGLAGMNSGWAAANNGANGAINANANWAKANEDDTFGTLLGAGAKLGAAWLGSDRRLKKDIELVGVDQRTGLNLYEFSYIDSDQRFRGVMADEAEEVMPEAVKKMPNGYKAVNYAMLGIEMVGV